MADAQLDLLEGHFWSILLYFLSLEFGSCIERAVRIYTEKNRKKHSYWVLGRVVRRSTGFESTLADIFIKYFILFANLIRGRIINLPAL